MDLVLKSSRLGGEIPSFGADVSCGPQLASDKPDIFDVRGKLRTVVGRVVVVGILSTGYPDR
eukprot:11270281-Ditylum_brightwellii.AAC.1